MPKKIVINGLSKENIADAIKEVRTYQKWVETKEAELRSRLANYGETIAIIHFVGAVYDGTNDVIVRVDDTGDVATIYAEGEAVAFIEFGSGAAMGHGHPDAEKHGLGPGTWSTDESLGGKGHWDDPNGWYYAHGKKSHGNPPAMAMVAARDAMVEALTTIAREVFAS